jgi:hypothetical protein
MTFPGRAVRRGDDRDGVVRQIQARLNSVGCGTIAVDGNYGPVTEAAVKMFQSRAGFTADGIVGPITWAALFQVALDTVLGPSSALTGAAVRIARTQVGVREWVDNRGPEVEKYLASVGLGPGHAWCVALVFWCFEQAATRLRVTNPLPKTGGVLAHWERAPAIVKIPPETPMDGLRAIPAGTIFFIDHGHEKGHMGLVLAAESELRTIEGNTNIAGSREGDGVRYRTRRYSDINLGYADYGLLPGVV